MDYSISSTEGGELVSYVGRDPVRLHILNANGEPVELKMVRLSTITSKCDRMDIDIDGSQAGDKAIGLLKSMPVGAPMHLVVSVKGATKTIEPATFGGMKDVSMVGCMPEQYRVTVNY